MKPLALTCAALALFGLLDATLMNAHAGIQGTLHVDSRVDEPIEVYINGKYVGEVRPGGDLYLYVSGPDLESTYLYARDKAGHTWRQTVNGIHKDYHWILK